MNTIDNQTLVSCISRCFMLSMDNRLTDAQQRQMNALGKRLRGNLINLLSASFDDDLGAVADANNQLRAVNLSLADANRVVSNVADIVGSVTDVIRTLDNLLTLAVNFV